MSDKGICFWIGVFVGAFVAVWIAIPIANGSWKSSAVSRGVAAYDAQTGEWKWTVEPVKKEPAK